MNASPPTPGGCGRYRLAYRAVVSCPPHPLAVDDSRRVLDAAAARLAAVLDGQVLAVSAKALPYHAADRRRTVEVTITVAFIPAGPGTLEAANAWACQREFALHEAAGSLAAAAGGGLETTSILMIEPQAAAAA